jgi:hypothetical protein
MKTDLKRVFIFCLVLAHASVLSFQLQAQIVEDTVILPPQDTVLRIKNFTPYFTLHVDSTLEYQFEINKPATDYFWYLRNQPVGLQLDQKAGILRFKAARSFFLSGKLKYDREYKVLLGVQNLDDPEETLDTSFILLFYNTEIIPSRVKPTVTGTLSVDEGDTLNFMIQCETGSFPIESITYLSTFPLNSLTQISKCGDQFTWVPAYGFISDDSREKQKQISLSFIGVDRFFNRDTAVVKVMVNQAINYPQRLMEYKATVENVERYIVQLKSTFRILDQKIKKTKNTRTTFDLTSASTALGGTIFSSINSDDGQTMGKILPSVGVALVPVKEAVAPAKNYEQNSASLVRSDIKRLQYLLSDNILVGEKDPDIIKKTNRLKEELKQVQLQLIDVPVVEDDTDTKALDEYFNNPRVNKKYRLKRS